MMASNEVLPKSWTVMIRGVAVEFPHERPYPAQLAFMDKLIQACNDSKNALLSSPTGTGKSLALLCGSLGWRKKHAEELKKAEPAPLDEAVEENIGYESQSSDEDFRRLKRSRKDSLQGGAADQPVVEPPVEVKRKKAPKVYFASRTHSQLSQLVKELRRTRYRPVMSVLGSRDQYCVSPRLAASTTSKNLACRRLLQERACSYYGGRSRVLADPLLHGTAWDVEDLVVAGRRTHGCPYYASRQMSATADLIFCPYNYLLEPGIRKSLGIRLKGSVVVLDEAHNIESVATDTASFECDLASLEDAVKDLCRFVELGVPSDQTELLCSRLRKFCDLVLEFSSSNVADNATVVWSPKEMLGLLDMAGIASNNIDLLREALTDLTAEAAEEEETSDNLVKDHRQTGGLYGQTEVIINGLFTVLDFMLQINMRFMDDFVTVFSRNEERLANKAVMVNRLHIWCLNPAVAFAALKEEARTVILASGTLTPMTSFAGELNMEFPIRLEAQHVIDTSRQLWAGVVPLHNNHAFNWTYKNTDNLMLQDALGDFVLQACRVVPKGVMVFFSSYGMLHKIEKRWKATGVWEAFLDVKCVVTEPNGASGQLDLALTSYCKANGTKSVVSSSGGNRRKYAGGPGEEAVIRPTQSGGLFLAVCRGKVSEGIDFADDNCRLVVVVGIPFPNSQDIRLKLKKDFNDAASKKMTGVLSGSAWYSLQAFRALNQAIGRCIRHQNDHGAVAFLDERFSEPRTIENVSKWIRPTVRTYHTSVLALQSLQAFFASHAITLPSSLIASEGACMCKQCGRQVLKVLSKTMNVKNEYLVNMCKWHGDVRESAVVYVARKEDVAWENGIVQVEPGLWVQHDGIVYELLQCPCSIPLGVYIAATNKLNAEHVETFWIIESAVRKTK